MDELNFQKLCTSTVHYRSLREQEIVTAYPAIPPTLSKAHATYVHLVVQLEGHWAAVQIGLYPFIIQDISGQTFYRCHYRYTLCCSSKDREDTSTRSLVENAVQTVYDAYYRPVWWNFSDRQSYTKETPASGDREANLTCTKAAELQLLKYMNSASKAVDDGVNDGIAVTKFTTPSSSKRPRKQSDYANITEENGHERGKRRKPDTISRPSQETTDIESSDDTELRSRDPAAGEETLCEKLSGVVVKKILKGLKDQKMACAVNMQFIEGFSIEGSSIEQDPSKYFESQLWLHSHKLINTAKAIAWKYRFLASCFRLVRAGEVSSENGIEPINIDAIQKWEVAAEIINMIVDGLAVAWGEKAELVYDALAVMNYTFSTCSRWSKKRRDEVVVRVIEILSQEEVPAMDFQYPRFHPAFCISNMLNRDYTKICNTLSLKYYAQQGLLIAKENLFRFPWEPRTQLAIRGTTADYILRETQATDSGRLNTDLGDGRQEKHSSHPGPGLEKEPFSSATAAPVSSITQGTQLPDSVDNDQRANDQRANDQRANDQRANDQRANDQRVIDTSSAATALEQSTTAALSNTSCTSVNELNVDPSQWTMQSQQVFEPQDVHRYDYHELASFDVPPFHTYNASDILSFPNAATENGYNFAAVALHKFPSLDNPTEMHSSYY